MPEKLDDEGNPIEEEDPPEEVRQVCTRVKSMGVDSSCVDMVRFSAHGARCTTQMGRKRQRNCWGAVLCSPLAEYVSPVGVITKNCGRV